LSRGFSNGPETPGIIVRTETGFFLVAFDFENQLISIHTTTDDILGCRDLTNVFPDADFQRIFSPADEILVQDLLLSKKHFVAVFDLSAPLGTCEEILAAKLAEGTAQFVLTDNDFFAFLRDFGIRANAFGFTAQGTLELMNGGGKAHYNTVQRFVFFPPDEVKVTEKINLRPDPR